MIAECLLIRDENRYLLEHLAYNAAAGIEHLPTDPKVVALMQKNGVNLGTVQRYFDVSREKNLHV